MKKFFKFLNNNWTVTIVSTMFGIILGLYITSYFEHRKLLSSKEAALTQVSKELTDNQNILRDYHVLLEEKFQGLSKLLISLNDDLELIAHSDSLESFMTATKSIFDYETHESIADQHVKIRGDVNLNIESQLLVRDLSDIIWNSYKQTDYLSVTKFKCLTELEAVYTLQTNIDDLNKKWLNIFFSGSFFSDPNVRDDFMSLWKQLLEKQKLLLQMYETRSSIIKNCS